MSREIIFTQNAPQAIGSYSQAVKVDNTIYLSGQIALDPVSMQLCSEEIEAQIHQVFKNLQAVTQAAGGSLNHIVKLNIYMIDLQNFAKVNEIMSIYFQEPFPARAVVGVASLPKNALLEADAIMILE